MAARRVVEHRPQATEFCSSSTSRSSGSSFGGIYIADQIPIFRDALSRELTDLGLEVRSSSSLELDDLAEVDLAICGIRGSDDWKRAAAAAAAETLLFTLVPEPFPENELRALGLGAAGAMRRSAPLEDIIDGVHALQRGYMLIDLEVLQDLCSQLHPPAPTFELSDCERDWLRALARGRRISAVAKGAGYSERAMYRVMSRLYARMGVSRLSEALVKAERFKLLD